MGKNKETSKTETLESFKADTKLKETKVHYRYAIALVAVGMFLAGSVGGYFTSLNITNKARAEVVNSIVLKAE